MKRRQYKIQPAEVWNKVRQDYLAGLGAKETAEKYGVGAEALRARATREGWSRYLQAPEPPVDPPPPALFQAAIGEAETDDPAALARAAARASGRAMHAGALVEARALAALADAYWKIAERQNAAWSDLTARTAPLSLIYDILAAHPEMIDRRFSFDEAEGPPDRLTARYWADRAVEIRRKTEMFEVLLGRRKALERRLAVLETALAEAGLDAPEDPEAERRLRDGTEVECGRGRMTKAEWEESQMG